jgi:hypothetical protein
VSEVYPFIKPGDEITFTLVTGPTLTGECLRVELDADGGWRSLSIREKDGHELHVRGDLVALWRTGEPITQSTQISIPQIAIPRDGRRN